MTADKLNLLPLGVCPRSCPSRIVCRRPGAEHGLSLGCGWLRRRGFFAIVFYTRRIHVALALFAFVVQFVLIVLRIALLVLAAMFEAAVRSR